MTPERLAEIKDRLVTPRLGLSLHREADRDIIAVRELVAEVERLRARVGSCDGGCNYNSGPEETCSLHGRPVAEVWQIVNDVAAERGARINALAQQVEKVRALHQPWDDGPQPYCTHDREPWPCPTEQALGGP